MKTWIAFIMLAASSSAFAASPSNFKTTVNCMVVTWDLTVPPTGSAAHWLFDQNVTFTETKSNDIPTLEVFHTANATYTASLSQHDSIDPTSSTLMLQITTADGTKRVADASAFWPRQPSKGELEGFQRLEVQSDFAEPGLHTQFLCDSRLKK